MNYYGLIFLLLINFTFSQKRLNSFLSTRLKSNRIGSDLIVVETVNPQKYNLLQTLSSYQNITSLECQIIDRKDYKVQRALLKESFFFSNQYYYFFNFSNLDSYHDYHLYCNQWEWLVDKDFKFPKEENTTRLLTFGDWSEGDLGVLSKNLIIKLMSQIDGIVFLGDMAYDLHQDSGEKGNRFLYFVKEITSKIPFQVL